MKRSFISVLLLAAALGASGAGINWAKAYPSAKVTSKSTGKLIMIDFYTDWCGWCKKLDSDTYPAPEVVAQAGKFVPVKLDAEKDPEGVRLAKKFKVNGYPTILFIDANENLAYKIVGYEPARDFAASMKKAATIRQDKAKFEKELRANPDNFGSLVGLASVYAGIGDVDKAGELTDRAAKVAPADKKGALLDAYNAAGDGFQNSGEFPKAISYFEKAINTNFAKQTAYARMSLGVCYLSEQKPKQAVPYLEDLLKMGKEADEFRASATQMLAAARKS